MSAIHFSADLHLGHANIAKYCGRPWCKNSLDANGEWLSGAHKDACALAMNEALIKTWNERVAPSDTVYHLGDFCCRGNERGVSASTKTKFDEWRSLLHGNIVFIMGNHDGNNGVKGGIDCAVMQFGGHTMFMQHRPPQHDKEVPDFCDVVLCGHVHEKWMFSYMDDGRLIVNVGVDQFKYGPVSGARLMGIINSELCKNQKHS